MATILKYNTTCDIYRATNPSTPPAGTPDVTGVKANLAPRSEQRKNNDDSIYPFTHTMLVPYATDIRDGYLGGGGLGVTDTVCIPNQNGTAFQVILVDVIGRGSSNLQKRVHLNRQIPPWPTNEL